MTGGRIRRTAAVLGAALAAALSATPAAAAAPPAHALRPTPAPSHHVTPTAEQGRRPVPVTIHPTPIPAPLPHGTRPPTPRPTPTPTHRPHPTPSHVYTPRPPGGSQPVPHPAQGPTPQAWSPDGWLAYVQLADARRRESQLKEERALLLAQLQQAEAEQALLNRQLAAGAAEQQGLGAASIASGFRLHSLEFQLAELRTTSAATSERLDFARLLATRPDLLLKAVEGGELLRLLSDGLASAAPVSTLAAEHSSQLQASAALEKQRQQAAQAADSVAGRLIAVRDEQRRQQDRSATAAAHLGGAQADLAAIDPRIAEAERQAWEAAAAMPDPEFAALSAGHTTQYRFIWPEPSAWISQGFGPSSLLGEPAYLGFAHFHQGLDLAAPTNTIVFAADDGAVIAAVQGNYGYGNYVMLAHPGGVITLYGHLNRILVAEGESIIQGQPIGLEGSTGYSTGPHLHFEVRVDGEPVDPAPFLPDGGPSPYRV